MPYVATLTPTDLDFGKRLTEELKRSQFPYQGVFWLYEEPLDDWELVVATELVDTVGSRQTYLKLADITSKVLGSYSPMARIAVISPKGGLYTALRSAFSQAAGVEGTRLQRTVVEGVFIADSYLYEVK